jgi:hypothetical protein
VLDHEDAPHLAPNPRSWLLDHRRLARPVVTSPDPELVAAVEEAMWDALADMGSVLRAAAADSSLLRQGLSPKDVIAGDEVLLGLSDPVREHLAAKID